MGCVASGAFITTCIEPKNESKQLVEKKIQKYKKLT
jgi:hypothetical protein